LNDAVCEGRKERKTMREREGREEGRKEDQDRKKKIGGYR
jgi:hypothetical protein